MSFVDDGYERVDGFLNSSALEMLRAPMLDDWYGERIHTNMQTLPVLTALHRLLIPKLSEISGRPLERVSTTFRVYQPGDWLSGHIDAFPIDVSASVGIYYEYPDGYPGWPLWVKDVGDFYLNPGDALVFAGQLHGRLPFDVESGIHVQACLFYKDTSIRSE